MKKILILTYYWPPSGGSGVQRWLKFVKYLTQKNFHCIIYTPENPEIPVIDNSLMKDIPPKNITILKTKIFEPYSIYRMLTGKSSKDKITVSFLNENTSHLSFTEKISRWVRGNFFIPDAKLFWIRPSVKYLTRFLNTNAVDYLISTGPPHSLHLIALHLKKKFPSLKWIADFRDPWSNIDFLNDLYLTAYAIRQHKKLEKQVVQGADIVISVSPHLTEELKKLHPEKQNKFHTITNGFDEEDYPEVLNTSFHQRDGKNILLTYAGLLPSNRNPEVLWKAMNELIVEKKLPSHFKIQLIGKTDGSIIDSISYYGLENYVERINYLPHSEVIKKEIEADALLLIINQSPNNKGILTGKLFEYLALQKPIIAIGPTDGDAADIIRSTNAGVIVDFDDVNGMKAAILSLIQNQLPAPKKENIMQYSRKNLTERLITILK